jgi:hypothetical protein
MIDSVYCGQVNTHGILVWIMVSTIKCIFRSVYLHIVRTPLIVSRIIIVTFILLYLDISNIIVVNTCYEIFTFFIDFYFIFL